MSRLLSILLVTSLLLSGCVGESEDELEFNGTEFGDPPLAPDFTLTDQHGDALTLSDLEGRVIVVAFVYTSCPDICIAISANMAWVQANLGEYEERVVFISITIDPARDTVEHLAEWTASLDYDWPHLTSENPDVLIEVYENWRIYVDEEHLNDSATDDDSHNSSDEHSHNASDEDADEEYEVGHSTITFILDKQLRKRVAYTGTTWDMAGFVEDLQKLVDE
ncbi:MAG: SCO family protein [Candidatus Poseidoniia archaeon]